MSKMRLLKASPFYHQYLLDFYSAHLGAENLGYNKQYRLLMDDVFGWADFWKTNLEEMGSYEVLEVVTNAEKLQKQWAKENKVVYNEANWLQDILETQIQSFRPEVFFAHDCNNLDLSFRERMKKKYGVKKIIGWDGIAQNNPDKYRGCDVVLSCNEDSILFYKKNGFESYFFPFAFETSILNKLKMREPLYNVVFSGSLFVGNNLHNERIKFLSEMASKAKLDFWVSGMSRRNLLNPFYLKGQLGLPMRDYFGVLRIVLKNRGPVFGLKMYQLLSDSKITLNYHIDSAGAKAGNMRLFEATGVGSCLVTDWKPNISEFFEPDKEVVVYKSAAECLEKINYLLNNENKRKEIARAGQKKTVKTYSFEKRIKDFANAVLSYN